MRLYLGTNEERGTKIIEEGLIRCNVDRLYNTTNISEDLATTDGFVYLTDLLPVAIYYGNKAQILWNRQVGQYYVFEVEISDTELLPDKDEIQVESGWRKEVLLDDGKYTAAYSLQQVHSVTVGRDLRLPGDVTRYAILPDARNLDHPLLVVTNENIVYRWHHNEPVPESVNRIPWVNL